MKFKKNDKGFSLVELIIVIAIMVALVAVLAPQFSKYVGNSRDAVVESAAQDVMTMAKSEFALGNLSFDTAGTAGVITVKTAAATGSTKKVISVTETGLAYKATPTSTDKFDDFVSICGLDTTKENKSTKEYTITISGTESAPVFTFAEKVDTTK